MTIKSIVELIVGVKDEISLGVIGVIILLSIVQVSNIKWNPWDKILGWFGKKINSSLNNRVEELEKKFDAHIAEAITDKLENTRRDILEFCNACMNGRKHTQEQFRFVLKQCDNYEKYIEENHIKNGEITSAIGEIHRLYDKCIQNNSFLKEGEEYDD